VAGADSGVSIESDLESGSSSWSFSKKEKRSCKPSSRMISDATLGMADGMTVPFALTAGLSAIGSNQVVVYGGLAELVAGMLAMGIGAYLSAKSEA
jgi:VIT1/CCC1 family predicted Fe2+/Mn2+ transporter